MIRWLTKNYLERKILALCPDFVKIFCNKVISYLPERAGNWIKNNKFLSICFAYAVRGLLFRPTMYPIYAALLAYFGFKD